MNVFREVAGVIFVLSGLLGVCLIITGSYGVSLWKQNSLLGSYNETTLRRHKSSIAPLYIVMTSAVLVIEPAVRYFHLPHTRFFFTVHLPCLVLFFSFLILATVFNGQKKRRLHNIFAPLAIVFGMVTIITGDMLVYHQLWLYS